VQLVPFAELVLAGILVADGLEADRFRQMLGGKIGVERRRRGNLDCRAIGDCLRRKGSGSNRHNAAQCDHGHAKSQHPLFHICLPVSFGGG